MEGFSSSGCVADQRRVVPKLSLWDRCQRTDISRVMSGWNKPWLFSQITPWLLDKTTALKGTQLSGADFFIQGFEEQQYVQGKDARP